MQGVNVCGENRKVKEWMSVLNLVLPGDIIPLIMFPGKSSGFMIPSMEK
jgi:hypothetical protein